MEQLGNKPKVTRLKEYISFLKAEENAYIEAIDHHEKEINTLKERCKQVERKIHAGDSYPPLRKEVG